MLIADSYLLYVCSLQQEAHVQYWHKGALLSALVLCESPRNAQIQKIPHTESFMVK